MRSSILIGDDMHIPKRCFMVINRRFLGANNTLHVSSLIRGLGDYYGGDYYGD